MDQELCDIRKRLATEDDYEFCRQAHHLALREVVTVQFGWDENVQDTFFKSAWTARPHELLVCDGEPCGYYAVEKTEHEIHLYDFIIVPEYQGRGIGTQLLKEVIEKGRKDRLPVRLQVLKENTAAARLYRRMGFEQVGETDTHFKMEYSS